MTPFFMGIDIGGTMTKAAVFDAGGRQFAVSEMDTPQRFPFQGWCERDMTTLWTTVSLCIRSVLQKAEIPAEAVAAIGCTGHGKGLYLWGKDDRPADFAVASTDHRADKLVHDWELDGTAVRAAEYSLQHVRGCQPAALLRWYKDNRPDVYRNIQWVFEAKDYVRFMLTGEAYAEYTDYSGTSLMNLRTRSFDPALLGLFGIEEMEAALPTLRTSYEVCGFITAQAAAATGLKAGTPVCGGMFDIDACAIAADVSEENRLCVISGTWSINEYISSSPVLNSQTTLNSLFCLPEYYLIEESSPTSVGNLDWLVRNIMGEAKSFFSQADRMVEALEPDQSEVVFLPFLYGSNSPNVPAAAFWGLTNSQERAHLLRALFEGVVFSHRVHVDRLRLLNPQLSAIWMTGGAVKSAVWTQMFADILGLPLEVVKAEEMGAKGAARAAAVGAGYYDDFRKAADGMVKITETIYPNESRKRVYEGKYQRYCKLSKVLEHMTD